MGYTLSLHSHHSPHSLQPLHSLRSLLLLLLLKRVCFVDTRYYFFAQTGMFRRNPFWMDDCAPIPLSSRCARDSPGVHLDDDEVLSNP